MDQPWRSHSNWRTPGPLRPEPGPASRPPRDLDHRASQHGQGPSSSSSHQAVSRVPTATTNDNDTISQGRRIYLGNLLYRVTPSEIASALSAASLPTSHSAIHISVDAVSGRNPGYCFVDFPSADAAASALEILGRAGGDFAIQGRPVKVGPCVPKGAERRWRSEGYTPTFERWGDWKAEEEDGEEREKRGQGPHGAMEHLQEVKMAEAPPRVWVGGLGKMVNQEVHDLEVRGLFEGFKIIAISKRITPREDVRALPGNHHYCFVDFESMDDAQAAIQALNGRVVPGGPSGARLKVRMARHPKVLFD